MKGKIGTFSGLVLLLGILGVCCTQFAAAQDGRDPFVTTVVVNPLTNFNYTPVTIPTGKRLVVDYVSISGAAQSANGPIQPIAILNATLTGGSANLFYIAPPADAALPSQFYLNEKTVIYADSLEIGPAFAGYSPSFMILSVVISGHLIPIPKTPPTPPPAPTPTVTKSMLQNMGITVP